MVGSKTVENNGNTWHEAHFSLGHHWPWPHTLEGDWLELFFRDCSFSSCAIFTFCYKNIQFYGRLRGSLNSTQHTHMSQSEKYNIHCDTVAVLLAGLVFFWVFFMPVWFNYQRNLFFLLLLEGIHAMNCIQLILNCR